MLVRLSETDANGTGNRGFRYSQARSNGGDLRFLDNSGSELKYEIANWNPSGESHVWVNIPTLKSDANITMYWGNPNAGLPTYANDGSVWQDYFGVYHLDESSISAQDSSPFTNDLTATEYSGIGSNGMAGTAYSTTDNANNGFIPSNQAVVLEPRKELTLFGPRPVRMHWIGRTGSILLTIPIMNQKFSGFPPMPPSPKAKAFFKRCRMAILSTPDDNVGTGNWQMLTLRMKDGYASVYIDGVLDGSTKFYFHPGRKSYNRHPLVGAFGNNRSKHHRGRSHLFQSWSFRRLALCQLSQSKPNSTYLNFGIWSVPSA